MQNGYTALIEAAHKGHADCVRLLIDAGADKDAKDEVRVGRCLAGGASVIRFFFPHCIFRPCYFSYSPAFTVFGTFSFQKLIRPFLLVSLFTFLSDIVCLLPWKYFSHISMLSSCV